MTDKSMGVQLELNIGMVEPATKILLIEMRSTLDVVNDAMAGETHEPKLIRLQKAKDWLETQTEGAERVLEQFHWIKEATLIEETLRYIAYENKGKVMIYDKIHKKLVEHDGDSMDEEEIIETLDEDGHH